MTWSGIADPIAALPDDSQHHGGLRAEVIERARASIAPICFYPCLFISGKWEGSSRGNLDSSPSTPTGELPGKLAASAELMYAGPACQHAIETALS